MKKSHCLPLILILFFLFSARDVFAVLIGDLEKVPEEIQSNDITRPEIAPPVEGSVELPAGMSYIPGGLTDLGEVLLGNKQDCNQVTSLLSLCVIGHDGEADDWADADISGTIVYQSTQGLWEVVKEDVTQKTPPPLNSEQFSLNCPGRVIRFTPSHPGNAEARIVFSLSNQAFDSFVSHGVTVSAKVIDSAQDELMGNSLQYLGRSMGYNAEQLVFSYNQLLLSLVHKDGSIEEVTCGLSSDTCNARLDLVPLAVKLDGTDRMMSDMNGAKAATMNMRRCAFNSGHEYAAIIFQDRTDIAALKHSGDFARAVNKCEYSIAGGCQPGMSDGYNCERSLITINKEDFKIVSSIPAYSWQILADDSLLITGKDSSYLYTRGEDDIFRKTRSIDDFYGFIHAAGHPQASFSYVIPDAEPMEIFSVSSFGEVTSVYKGDALQGSTLYGVDVSADGVLAVLSKKDGASYVSFFQDKEQVVLWDEHSLHSGGRQNPSDYSDCSDEEPELYRTLLMLAIGGAVGLIIGEVCGCRK